MKGRKDHPLVGRWRIVKADLWERDHLDLCGPAMIVIKANGKGDISFGAITASLDISYSSDDVGFTWACCEEGDQVEGEGDAEDDRESATAHHFTPTPRKSNTAVRNPAGSSTGAKWPGG